MQLHNLTNFLHNQLQQHSADAPELWAESDAAHIIMQTTHQAGKVVLLALLSILSMHVHRASVVILFPSKGAQQHFSSKLRAQVDEASMASELQPSLISSSGQQARHRDPPTATDAVGAYMLHEQQLTLDCGSHVTVMSPPASLSEGATSQTESHQRPHVNKAPQRFVLCIADHDLCTSDAQLLRFWTHLQQQQQQQEEVGQHSQAANSAAVLLSISFGHLGSLWRIVSMTSSLPGFASSLTGSQEPGFSTHLVQTSLPRGGTAHPMMLPAEEEQQEMSSIRRRMTPDSAAAGAVQQAHDVEMKASLAPWYGSCPGLLQWLSVLTDPTAVSSQRLADPKMIMAVGAPQLSVDHIMEHAEASGLLLTVLELDAAEGAGMLTASPNCFAAVAEALNPIMLTPDTGGQQVSAPPKLILSGHKDPAQKVSAMSAASVSAAAVAGKPIHGIVLLSWQTLRRLENLNPAHAVTDLYLCDLSEAVAPDSLAPLSQMAACGFHAVTKHLCGVFPRDRQAPQLWMQPGWHVLLDGFVHHCCQVFQHTDLAAAEGLEAALQQQIQSRASSGFCKGLANQMKLKMKRCDAPNPAFPRLAAALSPPVLTKHFSDGASPQRCEGQQAVMTATSGELLLAADPNPREGTPPVTSDPTLGFAGEPLAPLMAAPPSSDTGGPPTTLTASHPSSTAKTPLTMLHEHQAQAAATARAPLPPLLSPSSLSRTMLPPPAGATIAGNAQQPMTTVTAVPASHVTHLLGRNAHADSPAAAAEAAAGDAADQLLACRGLEHLTTSAPAASTAMSAAVSVSTRSDTPAASVNDGQDTAQPCLLSNTQAISSEKDMQGGESIGMPDSYTTVATAVVHSCGTSPPSRACSADFAQQRLGRDASIAQVLASLNWLPTYSNSAQHPNLTQLGLVTHAELPQQVESTQHRLVTHAELPQQVESSQQRAESLPLQVPLLQAGCTQLSCGKLGELPQAHPETQLLRLTPLTQQLSPDRLSRSPQRAHVQAARSSELQGGTQVLSPSRHRAADVAVLPSACASQLLSVAGVDAVSLPEVKLSAHSGSVLSTALLQSPQGERTAASSSQGRRQGAQGSTVQRPRATPIRPLDSGASPAFPWQQSLGLVSPARNSPHAVAAASQGRAQSSPLGSTPQDLFGPPSGVGQGSTQGMSTCLLTGNKNVSQHSSIGIGSSSILPGSQWKASWQPNQSALPPGYALPSTDRAGTIGSAFSAWAPAPQASSSYSLPSMHALISNSNSTSDSNLGHAVPAAAVSAGVLAGVASAPSLAPSRPSDAFPPFSFPPLPAQPPVMAPAACQSPSMVPAASQTASPRLSAGPGAGLSYRPLSLGFPLPGVALPGQVLPSPGPVAAEIPALPSGIAPPAFPGSPPHIPMLPGMPSLGSQWPLSLNSNLNPGGGSQPPPFSPFGYSVPPYPLGFGQLLPQPQLPFQFPAIPQPASSIPFAYAPPAVQNPHHLPSNLPYHLPPYPPSPRQALSTTQPHPLGPSYPLPSPQKSPLIKQEADSSAPTPFLAGYMAVEQQHPSYRQTLSHQPQLASSSWHLAAGMPLPLGDRNTPAGTDQTAVPSSALTLGRKVVKVEPKHSGLSSKGSRLMTSGAKRQLEISDGSQTTLPGHAVKGNKRCKLGPTEQLRVVVRQILAGVSREAKKHIKTSTASKGDLQLFIQLALGQAFDPSQPPELAVPGALSCILKQDVPKAQADQWLRRSNSGAPYFVSPELEEKLLAAGKRWPPCNEELLRNFKWDAVHPAAQAESEADLSLSGRTHDVEHMSSPDQVTSQANGSQHMGHNASSGGQLSGNQEQSSFAGIPSPAGHLY